MGELKLKAVENLRDEIFNHLLDLKKKYTPYNPTAHFDLSEYSFDITADNNLMTIRATQWNEWHKYGNFMITRKIDTMFPININLELLPNGSSIDFHTLYGIMQRLTTDIVEIANKGRIINED